MVCDRCEKKGKLTKVAPAEPWKSGPRKIGENKLLSSKKTRFDPTGGKDFARCRICKNRVHQVGSHYCQECAYKKGICAMCGKKMLSTKNYKQSSV